MGILDISVSHNEIPLVNGYVVFGIKKYVLNPS